MNSLAHSLCAYLCSRNNDIAGYWGIGILCAVSKREKRPKFSFKVYPGELLRIYSSEITDSKVVTDKLLKFGLDSIEGRLSFFEDGRYPHGAEKYTCGIAIRPGFSWGIHRSRHPRSRRRFRMQLPTPQEALRGPSLNTRSKQIPE